MAWSSTNSERKHAVDFQVPKDRVLDEKFWLTFGTDPNPAMRERIVLVTVDDLGRVGPSTFNVKLVCEALGISNSLINHHFGNRDELIAEATIRSYQYYVQNLWDTARQEKKPDARLRAWLQRSMEWSRQYSGLGALLNYPTASLDVTQIINEKWEPTLKAWGELNLARLLQLVKDVRSGKVTDIEIDLGNIPKVNLLKDTHVVLVMGSIGWSILGLSVWNAGKHLPTGDLEDGRLHEKMAIKFHLDRLIETAKKG